MFFFFGSWGILGWGIVRPNSDVGFQRDYRDGLGSWIVAY